jgi:Zn-dependent protease with chaperone function
LPAFRGDHLRRGDSFITTPLPVNAAGALPLSAPVSYNAVAMTPRVRRMLTALAVPLAVAAGCATVPYTHRSQLMLLPESQEQQLGVDAYRQILSKAAVVHDPKVTELVREVSERVAKAANKPGYKWEFNVIDDDSMINAFALPGGKVAVYTGLFPVAHDTAGLAAVVGHEVGHAIARHAAERMSQGLLVQIGAVGLSAAVGAQNPYTRDAIMQAFGLGAQVGVLLPFSRSQEAEADHIGLILMARAGYDPHAALELWQRFEQSGEKSPPEFLSTHPSYGTRQHNIQSWLPEAMHAYQEDPNLKARPLPALAELEAGTDAGEAAFKRYARLIDDKAKGQDGERIIIKAMSTVYEVPLDGMFRRARDAGLRLGEVGVASALTKAGAGTFDDVVAGYKKGQSWGTLASKDASVAKQALTLLREVLIETRRVERAASRR